MLVSYCLDCDTMGCLQSVSCNPVPPSGEIQELHMPLVKWHLLQPHHHPPQPYTLTKNKSKKRLEEFINHFHQKHHDS